MKKAFKKCVALVLTVAMLLSMTTTVFGSGGDWSQRDPALPVSLTVNHLRGTMAPPMDGPWVVMPTPPPLNPVVGATWVMQQVIPPLNWVQEPGVPTTIPNLDTHFLVTPGGGPAPAPYTNVVTFTTLPAGWDWGITAPVGPVTTNGQGVAVFDNTMLLAGRTIQDGINPAHGLWLVWETTSSRLVTESMDDIHRPFLVSLPTYQPGMCPNFPDDCPDDDCVNKWLYDVNVYPKQQPPPGADKFATDVRVNYYIDDSGAADVRIEYLEIDWRIRFEIQPDFHRLDALRAPNWPTYAPFLAVPHTPQPAHPAAMTIPAPDPGRHRNGCRVAVVHSYRA